MSEDAPWKLRLLCSVDIVGSTAYKSKDRSLAPVWAYAFESFYKEFPEVLAAQYDGLPNGIEKPPIVLSIWKFVGDEILFFAELVDYRHTLSHIYALKQAVRHYSSVIWEKKPLSLKASAWLAGFPVVNTEVKVKDVECNSIRDFIGPAVDAGFRISKFSDEQKLTLSVDLAFLLVEAILNNELHDRPCHLHLERRQELKGVIQGKPYPIVWVDMNDGVPTVEEQLLGLNRQSNHELLRKYLRDFINATEGLHLPFIHGDLGRKYATVPQEFEEALKIIREQQAPAVVDREYENTPQQSEDSPGHQKKDINEPRVRPADE